MSFILDSNIDLQTKSSKKTEVSTNGTTRALNFGNVSKQISFNDGNKEGYYQVRPKALKPSQHNPRPDWVIDDEWLVRHVGIEMDDVFESNMDSNCLIKIKEDEVNGEIVESVVYPEFEELMNNPDPAQKKAYEFLVSLSKSIREQGQIQPIEIESDEQNNTLVVLEGHLRRLACILGRIPYIKAIRNEGLHGHSKRDKVARQITENSLRTNISIYGNYLLAKDEVSENSKITVRDLSSRLKIQKDLSSAFLKLIINEDKFHPRILEFLRRGDLTTRHFIKIVSINGQERQLAFLEKLFKKNNSNNSLNIAARGRDGRRKSVATFQIKSPDNCIKAGNNLLKYIPSLSEYSKISSVATVEDMVLLLKKFEEFLLETTGGVE
jgi:ParB-like chromosome segregation protein Spo0J